MLKGIDVSEWQGAVNWEKTKADIDFAIIRLGFGTTKLDGQAKRNITELNRLGVPYGVYWFSYAYTEEMARAEAKRVVSCLKELGAKLSYPVYFDWEYDSNNYASKNGVKANKALVCNMATAFCEEIKKAGYYPGIYANPDYIKNYYGTEIIKKYDLWLAHYYVSKASYDAKVWQYSDKGKVAGVSGNADMNYCYVDYPAIINGEQKPEVKPEVKPAVTNVDEAGSFSASKFGVYTVSPSVGLWLRTGASTSKPSLELMRKGVKVVCFGFYTGDWYLVASESGKIGFCHSDYLTKSK